LSTGTPSDLKPETLLYSHKEADGTPGGILKVADFGFAKRGDLSTPCYTAMYAPPEAVQALAFSKNKGKGILGSNLTDGQFSCVAFIFLPSAIHFY
jgi:hypothetical protein